MREPKDPRLTRTVSTLVTEDEHARLCGIADAEGSSVRLVLRRIVTAHLARAARRECGGRETASKE